MLGHNVGHDQEPTLSARLTKGLVAAVQGKDVDEVGDVVEGPPEEHHEQDVREQVEDEDELEDEAEDALADVDEVLGVSVLEPEQTPSLEDTSAEVVVVDSPASRSTRRCSVR